MIAEHLTPLFDETDYSSSMQKRVSDSKLLNSSEY